MAEDDYILATALEQTTASNSGVRDALQVRACRLKVTNFDNAQSSLECILSIVVDRDTIGRKEVMNVVDILTMPRDLFKVGYLPSNLMNKFTATIG